VTSGNAGQIAYYIAMAHRWRNEHGSCHGGGTGLPPPQGAAESGRHFVDCDFATDDGRPAHSKCQWSGHGYSIWREGRLHGNWFDCVLHGQSCRDPGGNRRSVFDWRERVLSNKSSATNQTVYYTSLPINPRRELYGARELVDLQLSGNGFFRGSPWSTNQMCSL